MHSPSYFDHLAQGVAWSFSLLLEQAKRCPQQAIVLSGYSQGAMLVHRLFFSLAGSSEGRLVLGRVAALVQIADGDQIPRDHQVRYGSAPTNARGVAQSFRTRSHAIGFKFPSIMSGRVLSICNTKDPICAWTNANARLAATKSGRAKLGKWMKIHGAYTNSPPLRAAADRAGILVETIPIPKTASLSVTGQAGMALHAQLTASVGAGVVIRWQLPSGHTTPAGLALTGTGELKGTPLKDGTWAVGVEVKGVRKEFTTGWIPALLQITVSASSSPSVTDLASVPDFFAWSASGGKLGWMTTQGNEHTVHVWDGTSSSEASLGTGQSFTWGFDPQNHFSENSTRLIAAPDNSVLNLVTWQAATGWVTRSATSYPELFSVFGELSPDGRYMLVVGKDEAPWTLDLVTGQAAGIDLSVWRSCPFRPTWLTAGHALGLVWTSDCAAPPPAAFALWNPETSTETLIPSLDGVRCSPMPSGSDLFVWRDCAGNPPSLFKMDGSPVLTVPTPSGQYPVIFGASDGSGSVVQVQYLDQQGSHYDTWWIDLTADGQLHHIASGSGTADVRSNGKFILFTDGNSHHEFWRPGDSAVTTAAPDVQAALAARDSYKPAADGEHAVILVSSGTFPAILYQELLWDTTANTVSPLHGQSTSRPSVEWSGDGRYLASQGDGVSDSPCDSRGCPIAIFDTQSQITTQLGYAAQATGIRWSTEYSFAYLADGGQGANTLHVWRPS